MEEKDRARAVIFEDWIKTNKRSCNCNRGTMQKYVCNVEKCIDRTHQEYYCEDCAT